ncbi:hypothetical protein BGZ61DRAFT_593039 [Ilyonectria robusta]|uniref:uncharacterized protein n=1 Tax=Ilyonectria robusta TaxID=1079257 RepID=UPI001E8E215E|nr:uncharacterized protein BGZ61DRAFT_593039 [Ilyonectria robusta]KAH8665686.1 hypothetical protein BGZ61DRAFT_593039 [Ilyonectria robusta]
MVFTNTEGILVPELYNPATNRWTQLAPHAVPRNYHSVSILLPDATVFIGGGGLCYVAKIGGSTAGCDKTADHADGEIFQPPYLDQRRIPLTGFQAKGNQYTVKLPKDNGVLLPGYYYLFVMSPQGTPSMSKTVQITL